MTKKQPEKKTELPPEWSAEFKAMQLRGEVWPTQ